MVRNPGGRSTPATTIHGLRVKARAACWALLGELEWDDQLTTEKKMALSIVRDLIRLYDPDLERDGPLKDLVEDMENGAKPITRSRVSSVRSNAKLGPKT